MTLKRNKTKRKYKIFITVCLLASLLWILNHLSGDFVVKTSFCIHVLNVPNQINSNNFHDTTVVGEIKGKGFVLLRYYFQKDEPVNINYDNFKFKAGDVENLYYIEKESLAKLVGEAIPSGITIINISNDAILYKVEKYHSKGINMDRKFNK